MLYPVCCAYMLSHSKERLSFRTLPGKICTFKSNLTLILALLQKSTGNVSADEIALVVSKEIGLPVPVVRDAVDDLVTCGILSDAHEQLPLYHSLTCNPPKFPPVLSLSEIEELTRDRPDYITKNPIAVYKDTNELSLPVYTVLGRRHSCRNFLNIPVEIEKLFALCKVAYNCKLEPVASAGALFPLSVYFINKCTSENLPIGLYQYDPLNEEILLLTVDLFKEKIQYALNDVEGVFGAPCIFFICADIFRHVKKYANRGYRYTLLEAGHAIQNMTMAVEELGLGGVEYGGFYDEAVKKLFQMPTNVFPLACYAVGYKDISRKDSVEFYHKEKKKHIIEKAVCSDVLHITPFFVDDERFKLSNLQVVVSKFKDAYGDIDYGTGVASVYGVAYVKSIMEACERYTLSSRYFERLECAKNLDGEYLDPRQYAPYSDAQIKRAGFGTFKSDIPVEWLKGYDLNNNTIYIPADLCFNVTRYGSAPYHMANTSGCAAHFERRVAEEKALLEIIERDAIIKCWNYQQTPCRIREEDLPDTVRIRVHEYLEQDISLFVLSLPCEYAFTVLVCSVNDDSPPYFVSGAAASFSSVTEAAIKAFNEWEVSFVLGGTGNGSGKIIPEEVVSPKDHGDLYRYTNYNKEINYLLHGCQIGVNEIHAGRKGDVRALSPVFLSYRSLVEGICIVRAFSENLIPINFGYGMDFFGHSKVDRRLLKVKKLPHFFA